MSVRRIILLSGESEGPFLAVILMAYDRELVVDLVHTSEGLQAAMDGPLEGCRLISFCSSVIVPGERLQSLPGPAYNFHPGPPEYPGRYPAVFALYDGAEHFGITVHEMAAKVDAGPIVSADWFQIPDNCELAKLEEMAFSMLADKFRTMSIHLATLTRPMARMPYRWSGRKTSKADCTALCRITPDLTPYEIARRKRACGAHLMDANPG
ncbi:MAG: hypothetical protein EXR11_13005 [Rhodospirillaceae bacterium]|nr:hypothetical protein [Rhodospirillaceae bacterium]